MKSTSIIFITFNSINKNLSHALQMHTHAYIWRVQDSEPYSGIQGWREHLWTLVDPDMYMRRVDIFFIILYLFFSYSFLKKLYHPPYYQQSYDRLSPSSQHHVWLHPSYILLFSQHSPVIYKDFSPLVHMYKLSRYYAVFNINLGPMFPWSTTL